MNVEIIIIYEYDVVGSYFISLTFFFCPAFHVEDCCHGIIFGCSQVHYVGGYARWNENCVGYQFMVVEIKGVFWVVIVLWWKLRAVFGGHCVVVEIKAVFVVIVLYWKLMAVFGGHCVVVEIKAVFVVIVLYWKLRAFWWLLCCSGHCKCFFVVIVL